MDVATARSLKIISKVLDGSWNAGAVEKAAQTLASYCCKNGLADQQTSVVADVICSGKLSASTTTQLFKCLIPEIQVANEVVENVLSWILPKLGKLGQSLERLVFSWFGDLLKHSLCDKETVEKYYYSFWYALTDHAHLEVGACVVLYYISQPCDAREFIVKPLIARYKRSSCSQLASLLAMFKEFRNELVPLSLGDCPLNAPISCFETGMKNTVKRVSRVNRTRREKQDVAKISQPTRTQFIPAIEYDRQRNSFIIHPVTDAAVAVEKEPISHRVTLTTPAQIMSLLANENGFLTLIAAEPAQQARLLNNLEETLNKVILYENESYSEEEKVELLTVSLALQSYLHSSVSVVSKVLIKYLLMWDGHQYQKHVHALIEWLTFDRIEDWDCLVPVFRMLFRCCETYEFCALLQSLKMMLRNLVAENLAQRADIAPVIIADERRYNISFKQLYMAVGNLIEEVICERVSYGRPDGNQIITANALYFYQQAISMETAGDLEAFLMVPTTVVYNVLLNNHRSNIHHLAKLLLSYDKQVERLRRLAIYEDFEPQLNCYLGTYLMDLYRALFSNLRFEEDLHPGAFTEEFFQRTASMDPLKALNVLNRANVTWWSANPANFPGIGAIKTFIAEKLAGLQQP